MKLLPRLKIWLDPRRSFAARLLFGLFLAFLIPGTVFVFLLEGRVRELRDSSLEQFGAVRRVQSSLQLQQDASFRAEWVERRAAAAEEAAWALGSAVQLALTAPLDVSEGPIARDEHGHVWNIRPENDTVGFLRPDSVGDAKAREDYLRLRSVAPLMSELLARRRAIKSLSVWTPSGAMRAAPWIDIHDAIRQSGGELDRFVFNSNALFPATKPVTGDAAVWTKGWSGHRMTNEPRVATLLVPVRDPEGSLIAAVSMDVDARRYVAESLEPGEPVGDLWFAVDSGGRVLLMTPKMAQLLGWRGVGTEGLAESTNPERRRLAERIFSAPATIGDYTLGGRTCRLASARVRSPGWIFVEGLSPAALARLVGEAEQDLPPRLFSDLERYLILVFVYLLAAVLAVIVIVSRRITAPVKELVNAAEAIGQGRAAEISGVGKRDELGRLATAIDRMGRRVERRVETLRRLHSLLRTAYRVTDFQEILARASEAIAAFTRAERVWFFLYDPDTNRLEAAWPGWNMSEELAEQLRVSVDSPSIASMVFKTSEVYVSNDLAHDPYVNRTLRSLVGADSAIFCPVKTEEKSLGVVVATNRPGGFGHEEVDAMTSLADASSLLISNARLYAILTGTVEELRRASRLKDHFLQNVNHELRTPLTSIVGWTDLLEEGDLDEATVARGLKQVRQSARVLLALIDDLLDLARMDRGALALELRPVSLPDVLARSLDTVRLMAEARGVVLIQAPLPENMANVRADPLRLQQVLWNLLANAIKFTPRHGRVILRVDREPERYLICVEDDGIGIPESELPHIFERFRQVDGSPTRRHPGMGIGLALARSLVELHGGTIWVESPGKGSRFTFSLSIPKGADQLRVDDHLDDSTTRRRSEQPVEG
ncbi:MAG TPA: ATP-binding protein [Thermoanaerobaculia bacterium]|jgi:signal transduction histidine kinase/HAMP domain-containing protein|nr:ATP-binding protein [Thermoanaerobaculia bacterium]